MQQDAPPADELAVSGAGRPVDYLPKQNGVELRSFYFFFFENNSWHLFFGDRAIRRILLFRIQTQSSWVVCVSVRVILGSNVYVQV